MAFVTPLLPTATPMRPLLSRIQRLAPRTARPRAARMSTTDATKHPKTVTDQEWRQRLSPAEYRVLRNKGTERPWSGKYNKFYPTTESHFACRACDNPLYSAKAKFDSGCGWPAFDKCYKDSVATKTDFTFGMRRVEVLCNSCDGHLGHVFEGERLTPTNERHCVNSVRSPVHPISSRSCTDNRSPTVFRPHRLASSTSRHLSTLKKPK